MHLKLNQAHAIRDKLNTDTTSTNEELKEYFVNVIGVSELMAKEYLATRELRLTHPSFKKSTYNENN